MILEARDFSHVRFTCLLEDLDAALYQSRDSHEDSVRMINERAKEALLDKVDWINECINEYSR